MLKEIVLENINEDRPTNMRQILNEISKCPSIEKKIDMHYITNGVTGLFRTKDGNAYEITIIPAKYSKEFKNFTGK
jgi:hypothetical protein